MAARKKSEKEIGRMVRECGGDWKKFEDRRVCPHCHQLIYRVDNQPFDGIAVLRGRAVPIEIKSAKLSFSFADLKQHQRAGLSEWSHKHGSPVWLALQMGTQRVGAKNTPRRMWLIFWRSWLDHEAEIENLAGLSSIPYDSNVKGTRKLVREHQLGAVQNLADWELSWGPKGWELPEDHLFRLIYLNGAKI